MEADVKLNLKNILNDICYNLNNNNYVNEESVRVGIVIRILEALKQPVFNPKLVCCEYSVNKLNKDYSNSNGRVDVAIFSRSDADLADIYIEVKAVGKLNIQDGENQLRNYTVEKYTKIAILTDGNTWVFYLPSEQREKGIFSKCKFLKFDLLDSSFTIEEKVNFFEQILLRRYYENDDVINTAKNLLEKEQLKNILLSFCCRDNVSVKQFITTMPKDALYLCLQKYCEENNICTETEQFKNDVNLFIENINNEISHYENDQTYIQNTQSSTPVENLDYVNNKETLPTNITLRLTAGYKQLATGMRNTNGTFTVFKGSIGKSFSSSYRCNFTAVSLRRRILQERYAIDISDGNIEFVKDCSIFTSSSAAAGIILGRSSNGNKEWHK